MFSRVGLVSVVVLLAANVAHAQLKTESFDRDPGWIGSNNRIVPDRMAKVEQDFGYDAAKVAVDGGNPYEKAALEQAALDEGTRPEVHPFFYPPPFLLAVANQQATLGKVTPKVRSWLAERQALELFKISL